MLSYRQNHATAQDISKLLKTCDQDFIPPLSERVELNAYAARIEGNAVRFECWDGQSLVGIVAMYCNAPDKSQAFITNVSTAPAHRGSGISRKLLCSAVSHAQELGFETLSLDVHPEAVAAVSLYQSIGFKTISETGQVLNCLLTLKKS